MMVWKNPILIVAGLLRVLWEQTIEDPNQFARIKRGLKISATKGDVIRKGSNHYRVQSQSDELKSYSVVLTKCGWTCECPDYQYRKINCKHIVAALHRETSISSGNSNPNSLSKIDATDTKTKANEKIDQANPKEIVDELTTHLPETDNDVTIPAKNGKSAEMLRAVTKTTKDMTPDEMASCKVQAHGKALSTARMGEMSKGEAKDAESGTAESGTAESGTAESGTAESRQDLTSDGIIQIDPVSEKPGKCHCGAELVLNGIRKCAKGPQQIYKCKSKGKQQHTITYNPGFKGLHFPNDVVAKARRLFASGLSGRQVAQELKTEAEENGTGVKTPSARVITNWNKRNVQQEYDFLRQQGASAGDVWSTDEIINTTKGAENKCISSVMDAYTRFSLSQIESKSKDKQNSIQAFTDAAEMSNSTPRIVTSDSLDAIRAGFCAVFGDDPTICHISDAHIRNQHHTNNIHERYNSTTRRMLAGRRGRITHAVLLATWIHYNYFRPHMSLKEKTPAEAANIRIGQGSKMKTIIQNAAMHMS